VEATVEAITAELFEKFNREGSRAFVNMPSSGDAPDDKGMDLWVVDAWRVVRVLPHAGTDGLDFWVAWRELGWPESTGQQHVHLKLIRTWEKRDDDLRLYTDDGHRLTVEFLATNEELAAWKDGAAVRASKQWSEADKLFIEYFREMANES